MFKKILFFTLLLPLYANTYFQDGMMAYEEREFFKAVSLFQKACNDNDPAGCNNYAVMLSLGQGEAINVVKAAQLFIKACDLKNPQGCSNAASIMINYSEKIDDFSKIIDLFEKSCVNNGVEGCYNLAVIYANGIGVGTDSKKSFESFDRACELGHFKACSNVGVLFSNNDQAKADEYFIKSCKGDDALGCYNLGVAKARAAASIQEAKEAKRYLEKGCSLGENLSCKALEDINNNLNSL